jgi:hypothetical protein
MKLFVRWKKFSALNRQERNLLMNGLQVLGHQVCVSSCHFQTRVTENLLQVKDGPTLAQIVDRERMPEGVKRSGRRIEAQPMAQELHVS